MELILVLPQSCVLPCSCQVAVLLWGSYNLLVPQFLQSTKLGLNCNKKIVMRLNELMYYELIPVKF